MNSYDKQVKDDDIIVEIPGVDSQAEQFNKYGEVLFQDEVSISKLVLNNALFRKMAGLLISFKIMNRKRNVKKLNMQIERNNATLTGNIVELDKLRANRKIVDTRDHLKKEIEAHKKLREIIRSAGKQEKSRQK